ncbi:MAG: hypothetical protein WAM77_18790, partial [Xanthobacteraceae bacterium]
MPTLYFPLISESDYPAFRHLMKDELPTTFAQWKHEQQAKRDRNILEYHPNAVCLDVDVNSSEFATYCEQMKAPFMRASLDAFAFEKGN